VLLAHPVDCALAYHCFHHGEARLCGRWERGLCTELGLRSQAAVAALNTLQSNFSIVDAIRKSGRGMNKQAIPEMIEWCHKIGYEVCGSQCPEGGRTANSMRSPRSSIG
jgi:hypothetical protein